MLLMTEEHLTDLKSDYSVALCFLSAVFLSEFLATKQSEQNVCTSCKKAVTGRWHSRHKSTSFSGPLSRCSVLLLSHPVRPQQAWRGECDRRSWLTLPTPQCLAQAGPRCPEVLNLISTLSAVGLFSVTVKRPLHVLFPHLPRETPSQPTHVSPPPVAPWAHLWRGLSRGQACWAAAGGN